MASSQREEEEEERSSYLGSETALALPDGLLSLLHGRDGSVRFCIQQTLSVQNNQTDGCWRTE